MIRMICPKCGNELSENGYKYKCIHCEFSCRKEMSGHKITEKDMAELREAGETEKISFQSKTGKNFRTTLVLIGNKIDYGFNCKKDKKDELKDERDDTSCTEKENDTNDNQKDMFQENIYSAEISESNTQRDTHRGKINVRVESARPGHVFVSILGLPEKYGGKFQKEISYGILASRKAECLGCILAARYIKHIIRDVSETEIVYSINNLELANYILDEMTPRDKEMKTYVEYLWEYLKSYKSWKATYLHKVRQKLKGSSKSYYYPEGIFPYMETKVTKRKGFIEVEMERNPAVYMHFIACLPQSEIINEQGNKVIVSVKPNPDDDKVEKSIITWIIKTTKTKEIANSVI